MQNDMFKKLYWYLGAFMSIMILVFGIALISTDVLYDVIAPPKRKWLAIVFFIYAAIRGVRVYQQYKQFKSEGDE